jgi:hypothetical protein
MRSLHTDDEWDILPAVVLHQIVVLPCDGDDARGEPDMRGKLVGGREWLQILLGEAVTGRVLVRRWRYPAVSGQDPCGRGIDGELPGREHPHMSPTPHPVTDPRACLQDERSQTARNRVSCRRETYGASADDHNRQFEL